MNVRLRSRLAEAESLPDEEQDALADVVEERLSGAGDPATSTPEGLARIAAEPFLKANPEQVAAVFGRIGTRWGSDPGNL